MIFIAACNDEGVYSDTSTANTFARGEEEVLNYLLHLPETAFGDVADNSFSFSTIIECETKNELRINNEEIKLVRAAFQISEFGTDFYAIDSELRYAIIVSIAQPQNVTLSAPEFTIQGGNDMIIYRLRATSTDSFRIISVHTIRNDPGGSINICVGSSGIVFDGSDLIFNRISTRVSLNFRSRQLN